MDGGESVLLPEKDESRKEEIKRKRRRDGLHVMATGGGAHKFYDKLKERLGVEIYREDEMECLIVGQPDSVPICLDLAVKCRRSLLSGRYQTQREHC